MGGHGCGRMFIEHLSRDIVDSFRRLFEQAGGADDHVSVVRLFPVVQQALEIPGPRFFHFQYDQRKCLMFKLPAQTGCVPGRNDGGVDRFLEVFQKGRIVVDQEDAFCGHAGTWIRKNRVLDG